MALYRLMASRSLQPCAAQSQIITVCLLRQSQTAVLTEVCRRKGATSESQGPLSPNISLIPQFTGELSSSFIDKKGVSRTCDLLLLSDDIYRTLRKVFDSQEIKESNPRIAFLCDNDLTYVLTQLAIWRLCGVGVPLSKIHPPVDWKYFIENSQCSAVITSIQEAELPVPEHVPVIRVSPPTHTQISHGTREMDVGMERVAGPDDPALMIYTSGTTGPPKGVVLTHRNIITNINDMALAWQWSKKDVILHCLPLHHVHGVVNALWTPLFCGASVFMLPKFNPGLVVKILGRMAQSHIPNDLDNLPQEVDEIPKCTVFMGVPAMYAKIIEFCEKQGIVKKDVPTIGMGAASRLQEKKALLNLSHLRLMVSGSAALPIPIMEKWHKISGHYLLERYGMTEVGMALTNPLNGERVPGAVGNPFPSVRVKIGVTDVYTESKYRTLCEGDYTGTNLMPNVKECVGELYIKGPAVFKEYWTNSESTKKTFTKDGWFKTGDTAEYKDGIYRILGRTSVDIIKSGGYKISALDIERTLLAHPYIEDCAVVGIPEPTWGQSVAAMVKLTSKDKTLSLPELEAWCKDKLAPYKIPKKLKVVHEIPRNHMGKVNKKELTASEFGNSPLMPFT